MTIDQHVYVVPEEDRFPNCEGCGRAFDHDEWEKTGQAGDAWGGSASYDCPTDGCDGSATVLY